MAQLCWFVIIAFMACAQLLKCQPFYPGMGYIGYNQINDTTQFIQGWRVQPLDSSTLGYINTLGKFKDGLGKPCLDACVNYQPKTGKRCLLAQSNVDNGVCTGYTSDVKITFVRDTSSILLASTRKITNEFWYSYRYPQNPNCPGFEIDRTTDTSFVITNTVIVCEKLCVLHPKCTAGMFTSDQNGQYSYGQCWLMMDPYYVQNVRPLAATTTKPIITTAGAFNPFNVTTAGFGNSALNAPTYNGMMQCFSI